MKLSDALLRIPLLLPRPPKPERDRRATARVRLCLSVDEVISGEALRRHTYDVSTFGLSLSTGPQREAGSLLHLTLYLPDGEAGPVEFDTEVLGMHSPTGGVRVAFRRPAEAAIKRLHRLVSALSNTSWLSRRAGSLSPLSSLRG